MIKGGIGGANTNKKALVFERETMFKDVFETSGYKVKETGTDKKSHSTKSLDVVDGGKIICTIGEKKSLYRLIINREGLDPIAQNDLLRGYVPEPDEYIISGPSTNRTLYIIEKKYQETPGTAYEKLAILPFREKIFKDKIIGHYNIKDVKIYCIVNDWLWNEISRNTFLSWLKVNGVEVFKNSIHASKVGVHPSIIG